MNQPVWNLETLQNLNPLRIAAYLAQHGWQEREPLGQKASVWTKTASQDEFEILLPLNSKAPDFARRLAEALETLEIEEQRSRSDLLNELASVQQMAIQMQRDVINFAIAFPESDGAPIHHLGEILCALQDLMNAIGQSRVARGNGKRNPISSDLTHAMQLTAIDTFNDSFGIRLVSTGNPFVTDALKELISLINLGPDPEALKEHLFGLSNGAVEKYVAFLKSITHAEAGLMLDWGSPTAYGGTIHLTPAAARNELKALQQLMVHSPEFHNLL